MSTESPHMRGHTIRTTTRRRRRGRRAIAIVLGACALAIPGSASASGGPMPAYAAHPVPHGADYSSVSAIPAPTSAPGDGFDWGDASVGAGAALALVALGGTALFTARRRPGGLPSATTG